MRRVLSAASVAIVAAGLAACDSQSPLERAAANPDPVPPAKSSGPARDFQSAVAPTPAPGAATRADAELSDKVRRALSASPAIQIGGVEVAATGGVVTLYGTVDMPSEKDRAAMLALGIDGVRSVVNNLVVIRGS
jgi:hypothetical protein